MRTGRKELAIKSLYKARTASDVSKNSPLSLRPKRDSRSLIQDEQNIPNKSDSIKTGVKGIVLYQTELTSQGENPKLTPKQKLQAKAKELKDKKNALLQSWKSKIHNGGTTTESILQSAIAQVGDPGKAKIVKPSTRKENINEHERVFRLRAAKKFIGL